jgi:hypothetical protein
MLMSAATCLAIVLAVLAYCRGIKRREAELQRRVDELLVISDSLNRTQGRRARKITMGQASIGQIIRQIPALEPEQ